MRDTHGRADELFTSLGLADAWASLELDVHNRPKGGYGLEALRVWMDESVVSLKARLGELGSSEEQTESVLAALKAL